MTLDISKPIRTSNINDNQKHGTIYPDLRSSPAAGSEKGNANDQNLNKIFGTEESSFFNNNVNSTATVALSYFSGLEGYNKDVINDLINQIDVTPIELELIEEITNINNDGSLTQDEKEIKVRYVQAQIDKINLSVNDANEQLEVIDDQTGAPIAEEDNFNPDFNGSSIRWRYSTANDTPLNKSSDGITSATKYPNIAFPLTAVASDTGIVNLEANSSAPLIVPVTNNYQSDIDAAITRDDSDIRKIMNRYMPE